MELSDLYFPFNIVRALISKRKRGEWHAKYIWKMVGDMRDGTSLCKSWEGTM